MKNQSDKKFAKNQSDQNFCENVVRDCRLQTHPGTALSPAGRSGQRGKHQIVCFIF
jgi:hypothetical protein